MAEISWSPQAADDLEAIAQFISADSPHYAQVFVDDVIKAVERLADFPRSGRMAPELRKPAIREIILGNYRIVFHRWKNRVEILTVWHGASILDRSRLR